MRTSLTRTGTLLRLTVVRVRSPAFILSRMSLGWVGFGASAGNAYKHMPFKDRFFLISVSGSGSIFGIQIRVPRRAKMTHKSRKK
jgi:hypothetical protein